MKKLREERDDEPVVPAVSGTAGEPFSVRAEARACFAMAWPLAASNLIERASVWVTWAMVGHAGGASKLGPASLASTVNNVLGVSVNIGLSLATSTLASQASGAGDSKALGSVLQRAFPVSVVFSLPAMLLLLFLGPLLTALGRSDEFAATAGSFALTLLPVSAITGCQRSMMSWLAAQKITRPLLYINLVLLPLHALACWGLVFHSRLGYLGAGYATTGLALLRAALSYAYIATAPQLKHAWRGFEMREALIGWGEYLALALPGVLMLCEFWIGELLMFSASLLPSPAVALAALAIYQLTNSSCYQLPSAVRVAVSSRVGRALGAGRPAAAPTTVRAGVAMVLCWVAIPSTAILSLTRSWAEIFTDDAHVSKLLTELAPWLVLYTSLDALLAIGAGALTGCGRQKIGGSLAVVCYAIVGCPVAIILGFACDGGAVGIAAGHTMGKLLMTVVTLMVVARTDWQAESARALARISGSGAPSAAAAGAGIKASALRKAGGSKAEDAQAMLAVDEEPQEPKDCAKRTICTA